MGNVASVVVRSHLFVNGRSCSLALLKNVKATLTTRTFSYGLSQSETITSSKVFDNLKIDSAKDLVLNF